MRKKQDTPLKWPTFNVSSSDSIPPTLPGSVSVYPYQADWHEEKEERSNQACSISSCKVHGKHMMDDGAWVSSFPASLGQASNRARAGTQPRASCMCTCGFLWENPLKTPSFKCNVQKVSGSWVLTSYHELFYAGDKTKTYPQRHVILVTRTSGNFMWTKSKLIFLQWEGGLTLKKKF